MKKANVVFSSNQASNFSNDIAVKYKPYFTLNDVYFREGIAYAFINKYRYRLSTPARLIDEVLMVSWDDVSRIYDGKFTFSPEGCAETMETGGRKAFISAGKKIVLEENGGREEIDETPLSLDGILFIPIEGLMATGFGKKTRWVRSYLEPGDYLGISDDGDMFPSVQFTKDLLVNTTKKVGILREMYYFTLAERLVPYRVYVPSDYHLARKYKLVVWLHGAWPNCTVDLDIDLTNKKFEQLAEKYGYFLLSVSGYSFGFYGAGTPDLKPKLDTEEEAHCLKLCEYEPLSAIEEICKKFNIDRDGIFLCGNSMGGSGTVWEAMHHSALFKAIAPCGALTNTDLYQYDWSSLRGKPTLFVCGTENIGFENAAEKVKDLCTLGLDAHLCTVPAGIHDNAWVDALPDMFEFFENH